MTAAPSIASASAKRFARIRSAADKYLGMLLNGDLLVVPLLAVQEIVGIQDITPVPRMPEYIRGVINLRGRVLAVVDLRLRLGLQRAQDTKRTAIVVSQVPGKDGPVSMGLLVDQVTEVLDIPKDTIDPAPDLGGTLDRSHLAGVARIGTKAAMVLDLPRLLGAPPVLPTA